MRADTITAYVGLGSNLDDPCDQIQRAFAELDALDHSHVRARSGLYRSAPMGDATQPDYVNAVARLETRLPAESLLEQLLAIERRHGRVREGHKWGPRTLDLDLLLYGQEVLHAHGLTVPHPGVHQRDFVLVPLFEIAPDLIVPGHGPVRALIEHCATHALRRLDEACHDA